MLLWLLLLLLLLWRRRPYAAGIVHLSLQSGDLSRGHGLLISVGGGLRLTGGVGKAGGAVVDDAAIGGEGDDRGCGARLTRQHVGADDVRVKDEISHRRNRRGRRRWGESAWEATLLGGRKERRRRKRKRRRRR